MSNGTEHQLPFKQDGFYYIIAEYMIINERHFWSCFVFISFHLISFAFQTVSDISLTIETMWALCHCFCH